jgi:hypothetical protein
MRSNAEKEEEEEVGERENSFCPLKQTSCRNFFLLSLGSARLCCGSNSRKIEFLTNSGITEFSTLLLSAELAG